MKILSKYMYGGKSTYRKGGYVPQTQMSKEELDKKSYGPSKGPQRFTRSSYGSDVKPQTQMTNEELNKKAYGPKQKTTETPKEKKEENKGGKIYNLKNDKKWEYKVEGSKWFTRKKGTTKWLDISGKKFESSVTKLDKEHPGARVQNMKHGGTLMSRYAKSYKEGGTTDGLSNQLSIYKGKYGDLPASGQPALPTEFFKFASRGKGGKKWNRLLRNVDVSSFNNVKEFSKAAKNNPLLADALQDYLSYSESTKQDHEKLVAKGVSGDDINMYQEYLSQDGFKTLKNEFISETGQKRQAILKEIKQKQKDGIPLSDEEMWFTGTAVGPDEFGKSDEEVSKMREETERKMREYWSGQGIKYTTNEGGVSVVDYGGSEKKNKPGNETNVKSSLSTNKSNIPFDDGGSADDFDNTTTDTTTTDTTTTDTTTTDNTTTDNTTTDNTTTDGEQTTDEQKPPVVNETRAQKRKRLRKEWYESQSAPASTQNKQVVENTKEKVDPSDDTTTTSTTTKEDGTPPDTTDDFSGANPYEYGTDEFFDWKKRKRAATFAKRGALVKKINYLKGGINGKGNFRR